MTTIIYDNTNPFSGLSPTPFVGRQVEMIQVGDRWAESEVLTLKGQITGHCPSFEDLVAKQTSLISKFGKDFQTFQIKDDETVVFEREFVKVTNISFDSSNYAYTIPYNITLQAFPEEYFEGEFGVIEPKNEFSFSESDDGILTILHTVSAKGINTSSGQTNALDNARIWVQARQGFNSEILPIFINYSGGSICLMTSAETVNRLDGTHELKETFTSDLLLGGYGRLRYTVDYSYQAEQGVSTVELKGEIIGCKNGNIEQVRARYAEFDAFEEARKQYRKITGRSDLNPIPLSKGVSEDSDHARLGFSYTFTDDLSPATRFEYKVSFQYDFELDTISASIDGVVKSNLEPSIRWAAVQEFANQINLFSVILPFYNSYAASIGENYPLNPNPRSTSRSESPFNYEISLAAAWDNSVIPPLGLSAWDYSIQIQPSLHQYNPTPCLDGQGAYIVFDLGYKSRKKVSVQGFAIGEQTMTKEGVISQVKTQCEILRLKYLLGSRPHLEAQTVTESNAAFDLSASVAATYSCDDSPFTI